MGSVTHPRGRLPRRVYWTRRAIVLGVALLLVFGIGKLLGGTGSDDSGSAVKATNSSAGEASSTPGASYGPVAPAKGVRTKVKVPLLPPSGDCVDDEVSVLPAVPKAYGGAPITILLRLQGTAAACTFKVSPESLVVKITSGQDRIWSSQDCPTSIKASEVVVRSGQPVDVPITWSGRRSDDQCTQQPAWALPGFYHVYAAALGSTPTDVQFEVTRSPTRVVTQTAKPKPSQTATPSPTTSPSPAKPAKPTATVSGKGSKCGGDNAATSC